MSRETFDVSKRVFSVPNCYPLFNSKMERAQFIYYVSHSVGLKVTPGNRIFKSGLNESRETFDVSKRVFSVLNCYPLFNSSMNMLFLL